MIFVYIGAIIVFVGAALLIALLSKRKETTRLKKLIEVQAEEKQSEVEMKDDCLGIQPILEAQENLVEDSTQKPQLEDFELDKDEKIESDSIELDEDEDELDRKFAEYQKFLRENLDMDDQPSFSPEMLRQSSYESADYAQYMNKSPDKIEQTLNDLPSQARDVLLSNVLARKEYEDDDEKNGN